MNLNNRPVGRRKRVGPGSDNVERRGNGIGGQIGGPAGNPGGYEGRNTGVRRNRIENGDSRFSGSPYGTGTRSSGGCFGSVIRLVVIIAVIGLIYSFLRGGIGNLTSPGSQPGTQTDSATYVDLGEHAVITSVSSLAREKRTVLEGGGDDIATIMVYMCATDLESEGGMATADINEMAYAEISDKVNIILETGGTTAWQNSVISNQTNQRYRVTAGGLERLEKNLGKRSMVNPATLSDFIRYCRSNYPADRYELILWDHGGGSVTGYGYDQNFPRGSMTLDKLATALRDGGCAFDFIGFDACLMGSLETAVTLEPYADYMIASEEVEPGVGWYYTGWITALSENSSIATAGLAKTIIDDYIREVKARTPQSQATLSLIDLAEFKGTIPAALAAFARSTTVLIDANDYQTVSDARAGTKEFAPSNGIDQMDLIDFAENLRTKESMSLATALRGCIKYNRTSSNITDANGISIFFPYAGVSHVSSALATYDRIGVDADYGRCIQAYASVAAGGRVTSVGSNNMLQILLEGLSGGVQPSAPSSGTDVAALLQAFLAGGDRSSLTGIPEDSVAWLDTNRMKASVDYYEQHRLDASSLQITEKGGQRVLALPEGQWSLVQHMEQNVFVDDGKGFIDLGLDNVYEYNEDGDLIMEYDGTWLSLNSRIVSYYMTTDDHYDDNYTIRGRIPALLNGSLVDIIVEFTDQNPDGVVLGAQKRYDADTQTATVSKGLVPIVVGDKIDYLCDYYTYDGDYNDTFRLGKQYTATGNWTIENIALANTACQMAYRITDIYGNHYWTPSVGN